MSWSFRTVLAIFKNLAATAKNIFKKVQNKLEE
jgi:hypothetical protein